LAAEARLYCRGPARGVPVSAGQAGFTLVELMVVLAIMGLAAAAVILTLPSQDQILRQEADRLAVRLAAARDLAVVEGRGTAAVISPSGYGFEQRVRGEWQMLQGRAFAQHDWPRDIRVTADNIGEGGGGQTRILFSRLGTTPTPLSLTMMAVQAQDGDAGREHIHISASGEIRRAR
jgi:general secretion pathway protein H